MRQKTYSLAGTQHCQAQAPFLLRTPGNRQLSASVSFLWKQAWEGYYSRPHQGL